MYSFLIQAALFSEQGISMLELQQNMQYSQYAVKKLMNKIPEEMMVIKTKQKFKFYAVNLEKLNAILWEEGLATVQNENLQ